MSAESQGNWPRAQVLAMLKKLLGSLELEVMEFMWQAGEATVQQVVKAIDRKRLIAYTTVMTVMVHLVGKGLLARTRDGKRYRYRVAQSRNEFLYETSKSMVRTLVDDLGDLAIAGFLGEINKVEPGRLEQLKNLAEEAGGERNIPG